MKYLIIGGAGFIGCNFAKKLLDRGDDVTIFDNFSRNGSEENLKWLRKNFSDVKVVKGDIRFDRDKLDIEVNRHDVIFHLAAQVAVTTSVVDPREDFETNALGTFNVLEAVRCANNNPIIIYASTNKVYGNMEHVDIKKVGNRYVYANLTAGVDEKIPLDFHSPYGCSKGCGDQYVRDYFRIYGVRSVVMRQSCIYGIRQFGMEDQGWVAWFTIASTLGKGITIYGDGMQIRDILFVDDLFNVWDAAVKKIDIAQGNIYNIGGGVKNTMSLLELIEFLENFLNRKITLHYADWRPGDQKVFISNIQKASTELGWIPSIDVRSGVRKLYEWVMENKDLFIS